MTSKICIHIYHTMRGMNPKLLLEKFQNLKASGALKDLEDSELQSYEAACTKVGQRISGERSSSSLEKPSDLDLEASISRISGSDVSFEPVFGPKVRHEGLVDRGHKRWQCGEAEGAAPVREGRWIRRSQELSCMDF